MKLLALNYHYIDEREDRYPQGIYPISVERFSKQLQTLSKFFTFVGQAEILAAVDQGKTLPENACVITFDDGLLCQYQFAVPVLESLGIPAIFFTNTLPQATNTALFVHRVHWCRANLDSADFFAEVIRLYEINSGEKFSVEKLDQYKQAAFHQYRYDSPNDALLKFFINKSPMPAEIREKIIADIFHTLVPNEAEFCKKWYLSATQIQALYQKNQLGFHGHTHSVLACLSPTALEAEFHMGMQTLRTLLQPIDPNPTLPAFSYPYGAHTYSEEVVSTVKKFGFRFGFTMERAFNTSLSNPLTLARFDANDAPVGKAAIFAVNQDSLVLTDLGKKDQVSWVRFSDQKSPSTDLFL